MNPEQKEKCEHILEYYGIGYQKLKLVEELFELGTEVMHWMGGKTDPMFVSQEVADVMILCEQMRQYLKRVYERDVVEEFIQMKLERTLSHIEKKPSGEPTVGEPTVWKPETAHHISEG